MHKKQTFRHFLAGFALLVFALSITPRVVMHAWFASHKDAALTKSSHAGKQVTHSTYNCNCENIVAESPFISPVAIFQLPSSQQFLLQQKMLDCTFHSSRYFLFALRGPPSLS